ncbi:histidine kinase [Flavobacterium zepuense]|uniref:Histidine kinase n=1 Tax=Flavobacterium zepuense TaxID=2593302 RepID=A0A552VA65_9FLAO|nr:histidine kinase [Flavobacterium zepuense]TRW27364.1 histidine kinase [Flavobacterium zepuense]
MQLKQRLFILLIILCTVTGNAQQVLPFVENFTKSDYAGDNQVWNVAQGNDNALYFANNHFFLRYNGIKWEKYALPNKTILRSVFADGDRIYCGSYKEFGYWKRIKGRMRYFSLSENKELFLGNADNEEIWKIFKHGNTVYFQSFNEIYLYNGKTVKKVKFPSQISYCYVIESTIYVASVRNGMYIMQGENFTEVKNWPELKDNIIHGMEKIGGKLYIFTKNTGIYTTTGDKLQPWASPINTLLKNDVLLTAKFIDANTLAVGTALRGLYIIDMPTGTYKNINRNNSLKNNAVLSITLDKEKDLWLGLDNGISHIENNSPVSLFTDNSGILGSVYSLSPLQNGYLFVTNHGIFNFSNNSLQSVPNSQGQVWDIYKNDSEYIIGHNDGTFVYNGSSLRKVNPVNGGWKFLKSNFDEAYFQANYSGIAVYKDITDLTHWKILDSITKPIRNISQNRPGELWAADNYRSLYRITYDKDFKVKRVENVSAQNKIGSDYGVKIFGFKGELLFLINNSWYQYNSLSGRLEKSGLFNTSFNNISDIISVNEDSFLVIKNGLLYLITQVKDAFRWKLLPEKYYQGRLILENTQVCSNGTDLLINLDDGFIAFNKDAANTVKQNIKVEAFYDGNLIDADTKIKYNQPVEINVVSEYYGYNRPDLYYTINDDDAMLPVKNGNILLSSLSSGRQEIKIFCNNGNGNTQVASYVFYVALPWYFSFWMILLYVLLLIGLFFLYYRWNQVKYTQKIRLNEEELRHRTQIMQLEMEAENRLRQQQHEKHMLEMEVQTKASEVAGKSLSIAKHSEMIEGIQAVLESDTGEQLKNKIRKIIKTNSISKNEWQSFEKNLLKSHEEFVTRLSHKYTSLTPKDIKLAIYLKMNLSSKEIAPMMNISFRGVELHRYRLRKKLGIEQEESLYKFMINV